MKSSISSATVYCGVAALLTSAQYCEAWTPNAWTASSSYLFKSSTTPHLNKKTLSYSNITTTPVASSSNADEATNSYLFSDAEDSSLRHQRRGQEGQGVTVFQQGFRGATTLSRLLGSASIGTKLHLANAALIAVVAITCIQLGTRSDACSVQSSLCMIITFCGLIYDNLLSALGVYAGEGKLLKRLCKGSSLSHAVSMPFLAMAITEVGVFHGLLSTSLARVVLIPALGALAVHEFLYWFSHDTSEWALHDCRGQTKHTPQLLAGTMRYTSGKVLKCVLPAVLMSLYALVTGLTLFDSISGKMLFSSGLVSFVGCSLRKPDVQMVAETACIGLIWAAVVSL
jgi:hypothetical protein